MPEPLSDVRVRNTEPRDFEGIGALCLRTYPDTPPWSAEQLQSHLDVFPDGQFVAVMGPEERVVGMVASLIVNWEHYRMLADWDTFTSHGTLANHDSKGRTLYGAEVMVDAKVQHQGIGDKLYEARRQLARRLRLLRIRAGARLRAYHEHAATHTPAQYVIDVVHGTLHDPTLSFQLREGFHVIGVVPHYLSDDPESQGYAAIIEWMNPDLVRAEHIADRPTEFLHRQVAAEQRTP